jgi:hypothetical protein
LSIFSVLPAGARIFPNTSATKYGTASINPIFNKIALPCPLASSSSFA